MQGAIVKYGGGVIIAGTMFLGGQYMAGKEASAMAAKYELSDTQIRIAKLCKVAMDYDYVSYYADVSDIEICACAAQKVSATPNVEIWIDYAIDNYRKTIERPQDAVLEMLEENNFDMNDPKPIEAFGLEVYDFSNVFGEAEYTCAASNGGQFADE